MGMVPLSCLGGPKNSAFLGLPFGGISNTDQSRMASQGVFKFFSPKDPLRELLGLPRISTPLFFIAVVLKILKSGKDAGEGTGRLSCRCGQQRLLGIPPDALTTAFALPPRSYIGILTPCWRESSPARRTSRQAHNSHHQTGPVRSCAAVSAVL